MQSVNVTLFCPKLTVMLKKSRVKATHEPLHSMVRHLIVILNLLSFTEVLEAYRSSFKTKQDLMVMDPSSEFLKFMKSSRPQSSNSNAAAK